MIMKKKYKQIICAILAASLCLCLCACGRRTDGYGVNSIDVIVEQDYSLAFRNDDPLYFYLTGAIEVLNAQGKVAELSAKWLGGEKLNFESNAEALDTYNIEPRTLIIGVDINSFPMVYISNGTFWGFDIELAQAACDLLGWTLQAQSIEKENVYNELASGNIDVAWGGIALDESEIDEGLYTQYGPYIHNDIVIAVRDSSTYWNVNRLKGKTLAMPSTTEARLALESDPKLLKNLGNVIRLVNGTTDCFSYLYAGSCDAILTDTTAILYYNHH